jgi:hypothetical protein
MSPTALELSNPVKERMRSGEVALGLIVRLARSGDVARLIRSSDLCWAGRSIEADVELPLPRSGNPHKTLFVGDTPRWWRLSTGRRWRRSLRTVVPSFAVRHAATR